MLPSEAEHHTVEASPPTRTMADLLLIIIADILEQERAELLLKPTKVCKPVWGLLNKTCHGSCQQATAEEVDLISRLDYCRFRIDHVCTKGMIKRATFSRCSLRLLAIIHHAGVRSDQRSI